MGVKIDANDIEDSAGPVKIDAKDIESVDAGPEARRVAASKAPGERAYTDEELGLDPGAVKSVYVSPLVAKVFPSVAAELNRQPTNAAESAQRAKVADLVQAQKGMDAASRGVGALALAGPLGEAGKAMGEAAGLGPKLANVIGGSAAGAGSTAVATGDVKDAPVGAALGGAFAGVSDLMKFVAQRSALSGAVKDVAKAGGKKLAEATNLDEVAHVVKKYGLASVSRPQVAAEAIEAGISRAEDSAKRALTAAQNAGRDLRPDMLRTNELSKQAMKEHDLAVKEVETLKAMLPAAKKLAAASAIKPSMLVQVGTNAAKAAKIATVGTGGAMLYDALKGSK